MSLSRYCKFWKASDGRWFMDLADEEHGEYYDADTYGPFSSEESIERYLRQNFSNPGGLSIDSSGTKPPPFESPNGSPVRRPGGGTFDARKEASPSTAPKIDPKKNQHYLRDDDGRYALGHDAMCVCGHPKASHLAGAKGNAKGPCIVHEVGLDGNSFDNNFDMCDCEGFRLAPKNKQPSRIQNAGKAKDPKTSYKVYNGVGVKGKAVTGASPIHVRIKGKAYGPTKRSRFDIGNRPNVVVSKDGKTASVTDPDSGDVQTWGLREFIELTLESIQKNKR